VLDERHDGGTCTLQLVVPTDLDYFPGHFPRAPVLPGVAQIGWALQFAASRLGTPVHCREMEALKFQHVLRPGDRVKLALRHDSARDKLHFAYQGAETMHSSGRLVLASSQERQLGDPASTLPSLSMPHPVNGLLPHAGEMILLDAVLEHGSEHVTCSRHVPTAGLFHDADGTLPAWLGVELMAQAIAAWAGYLARENGDSVRLGFLLGTRHYTCNVANFAPGSELRIEARREFHDENGMGVFACRIEAPGALAEARLTVFSPPDASALLQPTATEPHHG